MNIDIKTLKKEILKDKKIIELIQKHNLTEEQISDGLPIFLDIIEDKKNKDLMYTSEIEVHQNGVISRKLVPTNEGIKLENKNNFILKNITTMDYTVFPAISINNGGGNKNNEFSWNENRKDLLNYFKKIILVKLKNNEYFKGVYLYGNFGVGKSFFTQSLANYFALKGKTVAYINNNDLASHLKQLFSVGYKKTIDSLKEVDFLFIDDIGSEKNSSWMLTEILFSILSYRMESKKTTFFTSNFSYKLLEKEFTKGNEVSLFKAKRLMERIEVLSEPILLKGNNWRKL